MCSAQGRPVPASLRRCTKHAQHGEALLDGSNPVLRAQKRSTRQPRASSSKNTQPDMLRKTRAAQQAHSRSQRADKLSQKRTQCIGPSVSAAQDEPGPALCSQSGQRAQQHDPVQAEARSTPALGDQLPTEEDMSGTTASTQAVVISLTAKENVPPNFPQVGIQQYTGPGMIPQYAAPGWIPQHAAPTLMPQYPAPGWMPYYIAPGAMLQYVVAGPLYYVSATAQLSSWAGMPCNFVHTGNTASPCMPVQSGSYMVPTAFWPNHPLEMQSGEEAWVNGVLNLDGGCDAAGCIGSGYSIPSGTSMTMHGYSARPEQLPWSRPTPQPVQAGPPTLQKPSQGSKDAPHPKPPKGKPRLKPDWRTASPERARFWLMYKKVFHRGGYRSHFQTMSLELPEETRNERRPDWADKSFLAIETRPEDDMTIPSLARIGRYQRDKVLKRNGGVAPPPGHKDHSNYIDFCELCEGYF